MKFCSNKTPKKFNELKTYFTLTIASNNNNKKNLKKQISHTDLIKRIKLPKISNKLFLKKRELSNMLEQIVKEDLTFNEDKLITNIKIESIEDSLAHNQILSTDIDKSFISKRTTKTNSSVIILRKNIKKKKLLKQYRNSDKEIDLSNNTLELNCNKMPFAKDLSKISIIKKKQNRSKQNSKNKMHKIKIKNKNMCIKNIDQFINKPNDGTKNGNIKLLISPLSKPSPIRFKHTKKLVKNHELHKSQDKLNIKINNETLTLRSNSKIDLSKSFVRQGKSLQNKQSNYLHFPSKSVIKNPEKVIN